MGFFDRLNIFDSNWYSFGTDEGDNHVWRDTEGTVCVRLYNGGVTDAQLAQMRTMLEQGDTYNVYVGDNDYPDFNKAFEPEGYAGELRDTVPPHTISPDIIPPMPFTFLGMSPKILAIAGGIIFMFFGARFKKSLRAIGL